MSKRISIFIIIAVVGLDQWLKTWVVHHIPLGGTRFYNPIIDLTYLQNRGAAWSLMSGRRWLLIGLTIVVSAMLIYFLVKAKNKWAIIGLSLALGGAVGNFIDRLRFGYVIDMFQTEFVSFPIFNIADVALFCGVSCLFIYIVISEREN